MHEDDREEISRDEFEEIRKTVHANNRLLKSLKRSERRKKIFSFIYLLVVLGTMLYGYYVLQPYLENAMALYEMFGETSGNMFEIFQNQNFQNTP